MPNKRKCTDVRTCTAVSIKLSPTEIFLMFSAYRLFAAFHYLDFSALIFNHHLNVRNRTHVF